MRSRPALRALSIADSGPSRKGSPDVHARRHIPRALRLLTACAILVAAAPSVKQTRAVGSHLTHRNTVRSETTSTASSFTRTDDSHFLPAVDAVQGDPSSGYFIQYYDGTNQDDAMQWGVSVWDELGAVALEQRDPGDEPGNERLLYRDALLEGTIAYGITSDLGTGPNSAWVTITFNAFYFDDPSFPSTLRRIVGAHETGHALGIVDHRELPSASLYKDTLMYGEASAATTPERPVQHDIDDYCTAWGSRVTLTGDTYYVGACASPTGQLGSLQWLRTDDLGSAVAGACFVVTGPNGTNHPVCDNDAGLDADPDVGSFHVDNLSPGDYILTEAVTPTGYLPVDAQTVSVPSGGIGTATFASAVSGGCPASQELIAPGINWEVADNGPDDSGSFDGQQLQLLDPNDTLMWSHDACVATVDGTHPASFRLTARVRLAAGDRDCWIWLFDREAGFYIGLWFVGGDAHLFPDDDFELWGPSGSAFARGGGGFDPGEDVEVTLTWNAETGEIDGTFAQGTRVETLTTFADLDNLYPASGDFLIAVEGADRTLPIEDGPVVTVTELSFAQPYP